MKQNYPIKFHHKIYGIATWIAVAILVTACSGIQPPIEQMSASKSAITNAASAGGNEFAPLQLQSAMEKMDAAERAMGEENYELALQMAEQAQVDANLALATARSVKAQKAAIALKDDNRVLRQEIQRKSQ
jgi:hypothetical protein